VRNLADLWRVWSSAPEHRRGVLSGAQNVKYSDRMLCNFKHGEGILAAGQWTGKDGVPNVVWREGSQRVAKL
jgi:hypothetical protein